MIRRPPRSTPLYSSAASDVYKRQLLDLLELTVGTVIAAAWIASPATAVLALPAMIYLHRTLTHDQLRAAARTDAKTGLLNAATWQEEATREISRATRTHAPLTVLFADLDLSLIHISE